MNDKIWKEKGRLIKDLPPIIIDQDGEKDEFSFQPIYELGRYVSEGDKEFDMIDIQRINCEETLKENVINFFSLLAEKILFNNLNFPTIVIDFVVFDPEDRKGKRFHIAVCSTSSNIIDQYISEIQINIDGNKPEYNKDYQVRGPILTNNNIYKSPYYYKGPNEREKNKEIFFHRIRRFDEPANKRKENSFRNRLTVFFGSFTANRENKVEKEIQKAHIEFFFDKIERELEKGNGLIKNNGKIIDEEKFIFNTSVLIPLLRPAASYIGDKDFRLRGGGLFLYGYTPTEANHTEIVARLQHFFYRNILNESHTQIVYDYLRHEGANHHIHDFKTFLTSQLVNGIGLIKKKYNDLLEEPVKKDLEKIVNSIDLFRHYLNEILEAYRDFIQEEAKTIRYGINNFEKLIRELNVEFDHKLNVELVIFLAENENKSIKANHIVLKKIFRNLYINTIDEYQRKRIPQEQWKVELRLKVEENLNAQNSLLIEYYNKGLKFNNELVRDFGIKPITGNSTGLGGYFINNTLGWMLAEENKFPDEIKTNIRRYIKVENIEDGVLFSFKFRINKIGV